MALYTLSIPIANIQQIRSANSDTLVASASLRVMNAQGALHNQWDPLVAFLGDHHPGDHVAINLTYNSVDVPDPTPELPDGGAIYWSFLLVNRGGHGVDPIFQTIINDAANAVVGALVGTGNIYAIIAAGAIEGTKALVDALMSGCDGVLAAQEWSLTAAQLAARTDGYIQRWDTAMEYPGTSGGVLCGAASDYSVGFSIWRSDKPKEKEKDSKDGKDNKDNKDHKDSKDRKDRDSSFGNIQQMPGAWPLLANEEPAFGPDDV